MSVTPLEIAPDELHEALASSCPPCLIDVREPSEFATCRLEGAELIPMRSIPQALPQLKARSTGRPLVFYCHHGIRSLQVVNWLRRQGLACCRSLSGGIDRWSATIDPAVPRY